MSLLKYVGGKSRLAKTIVPRIPEHSCYCEVFAGAAWILFKKEESKVEIINDINSELVTLYRVVKNHLDEFVRYFRWILVSREEFERFKAQGPEDLTDIQRAVRCYYLIRAGYDGSLVNPRFLITPRSRPQFNLLRIEENLTEAHLRLSRVYIENKPYADFIARYDNPHTFFYVDPPYFNYENCYGAGIFFRDDFRKLRDILKGVQGKFMMSINDVPEIRELFKDFNIEEVSTNYTLSGKWKAARELLVTNYVPVLNDEARFDVDGGGK